MKVAEFLQHVCDEQGPSQLLAADLMESMSPISFSQLVADISLQDRLISSLKKASRKFITHTKDRHPVTMEVLDSE